MLRSIRDSWVAALRSGTYPQTAMLLKRGDCYCCLGVLAELNAYDTDDSFENYTNLRCLGVTSELQDELVDLNDFKGLTFPEIADWVEANVPVETDPRACPDCGHQNSVKASTADLFEVECIACGHRYLERGLGTYKKGVP